MPVASALALAVAGSPHPALPQALGGMITGADFDHILQIAAAHGVAEPRVDDDGEAWIRGEMDGIVYTIHFLNCIPVPPCTSVQFRAWWASEGAHSIEAMNGWNRDRRFSTAYLDSAGNATIEFDVNLAGGVSAENFDDTVQWWQAVLHQFSEMVIEPGYATGRASAANDALPEDAGQSEGGALVTPAPGIAPPSAGLRPVPER